MLLFRDERFIRFVLCVALCLLFLACCLLYVVNRAFVVSVFRLTISIAIQNGSSFVLYVVCCLLSVAGWVLFVVCPPVASNVLACVACCLVRVYCCVFGVA